MAGRKRKVTNIDLPAITTKEWNENLVKLHNSVPDTVPPYAEVEILPEPIRTNGRPHDHRCRNCGKLLCRAILKYGSEVEIRCQRCGRICIFAGPQPMNDIINE